MAKTALIVGAGSGISALFARLLAKDGYRVALASRDPAKLTRLAAETKATTHACDAAGASFQLQDRPDQAAGGIEVQSSPTTMRHLWRAAPRESRARMAAIPIATDEGHNIGTQISDILYDA